MSFRRPIILASTILATACAFAQNGFSSQVSDPRAKELIQSAVRSELAAAANDHSTWTYRDHDKAAAKDAVYHVIETPAGSVRRMIELNGRPVDSDTVQKESERITDFIHDTSAQAKQRRAGAHDDEQARQMLLMLPNAFIWSIKGSAGDLITLVFRPNPTLTPPIWKPES